MNAQRMPPAGPRREGGSGASAPASPVRQDAPKPRLIGPYLIDEMIPKETPMTSEPEVTEAVARAIEDSVWLHHGSEIDFSLAARAAIAAMSRARPVEASEGVERRVLRIEHQRKQPIAAVYEENGCEVMRCSISAPSAPVTMDKVEQYLRREADFARHAQKHAKSDTDKLYRMGQKDGLLLACDGLRAALNGAETVPVTVDGEGQDITTAPKVEPGRQRFFVVAVKRHHREEPFTFPALYLNRFPLDYDDEPYEREVTGWYSAVGDGGDGLTYTPLLGEGDELLGWQALPVWSAPPALQGQTRTAGDGE